MDWTRFDEMIEAALEEDGAREDATTNALVPPDMPCKGRMIAKQEGVICGLHLGQRVCGVFDSELDLTPVVEEGDRVGPGAVAARCEGPASSLLKVERTLLNFIQRLSGVATLTSRYVEAVAGTGAKILDTRKTTPGWRWLEKYAVRSGGGTNHRMGLHDMVLIKDNHLELCAQWQKGRSISDAVRIARDEAPGLPVEVEVETLTQLEEALETGPDVVLLDNMTPGEVARACALTRAHSEKPRPELEASGAIDLSNVRDYAEAGADRISIGALTHSAPALDISLNIS